MKDRLAHLDPAQKRALLKKLLAEKAAAAKAPAAPSAPSAPAITPEPARRGEPFPLTEMQQAYLVGRNPAVPFGGVACHTAFEVEVGALDAARLEDVLNALIARTEALRVVLTPSGEQRVIAEAPRYVIEVADLRGADADAQTKHLAAVRESMAARQRDPEEWPLFEVRATRLADDDLRLHVDVDLIGLDALSLMVLIDTWGRVARGEALPEAPALGLRDYHLAAREAGEDARSRDYWMGRLDQIAPGPELPRLPGPPASGASTTRRRHRLDAEAAAGLRRRAKALGVTLNSLICAAYADALATFSRRPRFTLNLTRFDRRPLHPEVGSLLGEFTTTTLLGVDARGATFAERARAVQSALAEALDHADFSGVAVLRALNRSRGQAGEVMMPVVFTSLLGLARSGRGSQATASLGRLGWGSSQTPQVWVDHQLYPEGDALVSQWDVMDGVIPCHVVDAMFDGYAMLLDRLADDSDAMVASLPPLALMPSAQRERRVELNATEAALPETWLHTPFEDRADDTPDAVAVIDGAVTLTYGETARLARHLAVQLVERGVGPGVLVALCMRRGWQQVVGSLAILMAGGAYLPLEAGLPAERIRRVLDRAEVKLALVQGEAGAEWAEGVERISVDALAREVKGAAPARWAPRQQKTDLAYVIYTSGSTGEPKGVMIDHRGAANTIHDINQRMAVGPTDRALGLSSMGFDLSVYDVFGLLAAGGALVVVPEPARRDPAVWATLCRQHAVTLWNSVPALMEMMTEHAELVGEPLPEALRHVMMSGDWIPLDLPGRIAARSDTAITSLGGATEGSIWSILHPVDPAAEKARGWSSIPYGRPMLNQTMHVLNAAGAPCPEGVVGELYIGGVGVALGYYNDAERTAERFSTHPEHGRLYWTGDLARVHPDGLIEFLGRDDHQIKIRGHRVELGEIEGALTEAPEVASAVVIATGPARRLERLVAYVTPSGAATDPAPGAWAALCAAGAASGEKQGAGVDAAAFTRRIEQLDRVTVQACAVALRRLGVPAGSTVDEALRAGGIEARYRPWLARTLAFVDEFGVGEGTEAVDWSAVDADDPATARVLAYLRMAAERLPETLTGAALATDLLFTDGEAGAAEDLYRDWFLPCNVVVADALGALMEAWPHDRPLRVLEVGAGIGSATEHVLPRLPADRCHYTYTDVSPFFLNHGRERFGARGAMTFELLDLERAPLGQAGRYDVVLAASVLHATRDIAETLDHVRQLLAPGGRLVFIEETRFRAAFNMTMGLQQGFDRFTDDRERHPLLGAERWVEALTAAGFDAPRVFGQPGSTSEPLGFAVLAARVEGGVDADALGARVAQRLPSYMQPDPIVVLDRLPLSANGKVDRKALPDVSGDGAARRAPFTAPETEAEQAVAAVWREELGVEQVGLDDNFFDLGGDSLLMVRIRARLAERLEREISVVDLFAHTTVRALGAHLSAGAAEAEAGEPEGGGLLAQSAKRRRRRRR